MKQRIHYKVRRPQALETMMGFSKYLSTSSVDKQLFHLIDYRVSQINGCAFCLDMHSKDLLAEGETPQRLFMMDAWRETPFFTEKERASLAWAEALTVIRDGNVPDAIYDEARKHFSEAELVDITMAVIAINGWNRINIAFGNDQTGKYRPQQSPSKNN